MQLSRVVIWKTILVISLGYQTGGFLSKVSTNCVDRVSQCSSQVYRDVVCKDDTAAITFCQKSCGKCPVDGGYSTWLPWSDCSLSCGGSGQSFRVRTCDNPKPQYNGQPCQGNKIELKTCDNGPCSAGILSTTPKSARSSSVTVPTTTGLLSTTTKSSSSSPATVQTTTSKTSPITVVNPCTPNPCVHGSCTAAGSTYSCKCNLGYRGVTCNTRHNTTRGHICYHCDHPVDDPKQCDQIRICSHDQFCSLEQFITPNGYIRYQTSCKDRQMCGGSTVPSTYMVVCSECCDTDLCSATGCNLKGYNTTRGPICYHCDSPVYDPKQCDKIRLCSHDQVCGIHETPYGQYKMECESKTTCNTIKNLGVCSACCTTDLCNRQCTVQPGTGTTIPSVTCQDSKDCKTIAAAYLTSHGLEVCRNQNLKHFCNSTCGLCPGQTTRAPFSTASTTVATPATTVVNPCTPNPCVHGSCTAYRTTYSCKCNSGYLGSTCNVRNPCSALPCIHGNCSATPSGGFHCLCTPGYTGVSCGTDINECQPSPCYNGVCVDEINGYRCNCNPGFTGPHCQTEIDECQSRPCSNHGICLDEVNGYTCRCFPGYTGKQCTTDINECLSNPCLNGGTCHDGVNSFTCTCKPGYNGSTCSQNINECLSNPCLNGGTCHDGQNSFTCSCTLGYIGPTCSQKINECQSRPCLNNGLCIDQVNGYICLCLFGYTGKQCATDINECLSNPCLNGGTCHDGVNNFTCTCTPGYNGSTCSQKAKIRDCKDVLDYGLGTLNGIYTIDLGSSKTDVYCDMTTTGGGWTVLMYRADNKVDFQHRNSSDYALGFGNKHTDFWQGLDDMHSLTSDGRQYELRVDLRAANGSYYYEIYDGFFIGPARDFTLYIGNHLGTAGDSLSGHNKHPFTTTDRDVDMLAGTNCADYLQGSWWFHDCFDSCLTCPYIHATPGMVECRSMSWNALGYCEPLRMAKMMIRPM